jgi:hypothetical protein
MKRLYLVGISLLAVSACAPQAAPPPALPAPVAQSGVYATTNTTAAFDGTYDRFVVAGKTPGCPDLNLPPNLTIQNGLAVLQGYNLTFQGYVTPQGALTMNSGSGQVFQGKIDPQFTIRGRVTGLNCAYDMSWSRV